MKLEDQVCTFEQARKFRYKLRLNLESFFVYEDGAISKDKPLYVRSQHTNHIKRVEGYGVRYLPAYTVAELGVLLGKYQLVKFDNRWQICKRIVHPIIMLGVNRIDLPEAQARADALIWLIEEDFIKAEDLKL